MLLQSATAVGVLAAGFAASGILAPGTGLAALLGADAGSALVVRVLSLDLSELVPVLILTGCALFLKFENRRLRQYGRIVLGIGFVLLSLRMIGQATEPLRDSAALPAVMAYLSHDPLTAFVLAAALAWAVHSSVAMVLLLATLAQGGALPMAVALPMLMGANMGGALIAVWLTRGMEPVARRIPLGNLILRGSAALVVLALDGLTGFELPNWLGAADAVRIVNAHLLFNVLVALLALALADLRSMRLPDPLMLAATVLGILLVALGDGTGWPDLQTRLAQATLGALAGGGAFWLLRAAYRWRSGRDGMGMGDVLLAAVLGLVLQERLPLAVLIAALTALALALLRAWRKRRPLRRLGRVPFGAALALAGAFVAVLT